MNWKALLEVRPIKTPDGKTLHTLADARTYLLEMPETDATLQAAGELLKAAEHGGPFLMLARMSVYSAIYGATDIRQPPPPAKAKKRDRWRERRKKR
jgi:hypothetical protein